MRNVRLLALSVPIALFGCTSEATNISNEWMESPVRALSTTDTDRLVAMTVAADGTIYAAGSLATGTDWAMAVTHYKANGSLDTSFGNGGIAVHDVAVGGLAAETARGVVVQSTGKIVVAGPAEHDTSAPGDALKDTDIVLVRFTAQGQLDASFGQNGVTRLDASTGVAVSSTSFVGDIAWGLTLLPNDELLVIGGKRAADEARTDTDFAVVKFTANGSLDTSFATLGILSVDVEEGIESPRKAIIQADGKILACGYTRSAANVTRPVVFRFSQDGTLDPDFGTDGVIHPTLLPSVFEAYDIARQNDNIIIAGYGKAEESLKVDVVSARFNSHGALDAAYGTQGIVQIDIAGEDDRARDIVMLPGQRILITGSGKPASDQQDGLIAVLTPDGARDTTFGDNGIELMDFGGPTDSLFQGGLTLDGKHVVVVGWKGINATSGGNDDAVILRVEDL